MAEIHEPWPRVVLGLVSLRSWICFVVTVSLVFLILEPQAEPNTSKGREQSQENHVKVSVASECGEGSTNPWMFLETVLYNAATVGAAAATDHEVAQLIRSLTLNGPTAYGGYTNSVLLEAWAPCFGLVLDLENYATGFQNGAFNYSMESQETGHSPRQELSDVAIALISGLRTNNVHNVYLNPTSSIEACDQGFPPLTM